MKIKLSLLVLALIAAVAAGCGSTYDPEPKAHHADAAYATPSDWYDDNGDAIGAIVADLTAAGNAGQDNARSEHAEYMASKSADVQDAQSRPPIPNADAEDAWRSALDHLASGADLCTSGIDTMDADDLTQSAAEISAAQDDLATATDALGG